MPQLESRTALAAAAAAALLGAAFLATYMQRFRARVSGGAPVALLTTRMQVPAGTPLADDMLVTHLVPEAYVEDRQVLATEKSRVIGIATSVNLAPNQTLTWTDLTTGRRDELPLSSRVPSGMRAMSVSLGVKSGLSPLLRPGDRVDVLLTTQTRHRDEDAITVVLLQGILVLAVGDRLTPFQEGSSASIRDSVALLVSLDQATLLTHARRSGELSLALRKSDDLEINEGALETSDRHVFVEESRARRQKRSLIERLD